jgi:hypothetical protein
VLYAQVDRYLVTNMDNVRLIQLTSKNHENSEQ